MYLILALSHEFKCRHEIFSSKISIRFFFTHSASFPRKSIVSFTSSVFAFSTQGTVLTIALRSLSDRCGISLTTGGHLPITSFLASYAGLSGIASCARRGSRSVALQPSGERLLWPCRSARRSARFGPDLELRHASVGGGRNASLVAKAPTVEVGSAPRVRRPGASVQLGVAGSAAGPFAVLLHTCGPRASRGPAPAPTRRAADHAP